jgi:predicted nuclease of restriction endonuclease-like (RecB) superfamily
MTLDSDCVRTRLVSLFPLVRSGEGLLRQDLEAAGYRTRALKIERPTAMKHIFLISLAFSPLVCIMTTMADAQQVPLPTNPSQVPRPAPGTAGDDDWIQAGKIEASDLITPEEEIKDPFVLEFLGLKDEYSESDLEEALIIHLEAFLLELGGDFAFIGRQRRLRIGDEWYWIDLLFFHRKLRSLIVIDLKLGRFTHADAGQMHLYLNYAREHWMHDGENPPVGVILCAQKDEAVAHYALEGLANKVLAREYMTVLPSEKLLAREIEKVRNELRKRENRNADLFGNVRPLSSNYQRRGAVPDLRDLECMLLSRSEGSVLHFLYDLNEKMGVCSTI